MAVHRVQAALLQRLAGLMVGRPRRGVVGSSRQARQLRQDLHAAAHDRQRRTVLLQGEPGLEKDNLAALIHFGSSDRQQLMLRVEGGRLRGDGSELFGSDSVDGEPPLLELLEKGTLLVDDIDQVSQPLRSALIQLACRGEWRPQHRQHNGALNLFWAWWWPLILLGFPVVGRLWCSFCPFMVWGEISQRLVRVLGWQPSAWPHGEHDRWASIVLSAGFALILIWEAVWNLSDTAWLSSCLLLLITAGAVLASIRFEKRFWCRYLCPIGGMNGLFAKLSILELRAQAGICSGNCSSYACFKGGPAEGEGMATSGCPLGTHPAHLRDNRNCVLCLTCAQACAHRSVQLAVRPPAADLQRQMVIPTGEPALLLILAGSVCLHHWQGLWPWLPFAPASLVDGPLLPRLLLAAMSLALPAGLYLAALPLLNLQRLRRTLYGMLPLFWALLLADHLPLGLLEAGQLLPVSFSSAAPFGLSEWPQWSADWHVVQFCQSLVVVLGAVASVVVLRRLLCNHRIAWLGGCAVMVMVAISGRWLVGV